MINAIKTQGYQESKPPVRFYNAKVNSPMPAPLGGLNAKRRTEIAKQTFQVRKQLLNEILQEQSSAYFNRLLLHLEPVVLRRGENLYKPGEVARYAYFLEDAVVSHLHVLADGSTIEIAMMGSEGVAGLSAVFGESFRSFWTEVISGGTALRIPIDALKLEFRRYPAIQESLLQYMNQYVTQISQRVICNAHHMVEERFCNWLLMLHDRVKNARLPLTQDQIARYLGVHRPSVTHIAQSLRERGAINYVRGYVEILDRAQLERLSCECYQPITENVSNNLPTMVNAKEAMLIA